MKHSSFLSTSSFQNFHYPAGSPVNLMAYCDQITISYTNHCFNFFSLFSNYLCLVSFCCILLTLLAVLLYILFYKTIISFITQCTTRPLKKIRLNVLRQSTTYITLYKITVTVKFLDMGRSNKEKNIFLDDNWLVKRSIQRILDNQGSSKKFSTLNKLSTESSPDLGMSFPRAMGQSWSWNALLTVGQIHDQEGTVDKEWCLPFQ